MPKEKLSHITDAGHAHMVDISNKNITKRIATAQSIISMKNETMAAIMKGETPKGDVLSTARIAGIMAAKKCSDLIPMCHPLAITGVEIEFEKLSDTELCAKATVKTTGKTGVEMEALTAASLCTLTIYDMAKAIDKDMVIKQTYLLEKKGGKSGDYQKN